MVSGIVRPPALDLANRDLVEAHLHAVWLAESAQDAAGRHPARPRSDTTRLCRCRRRSPTHLPIRN